MENQLELNELRKAQQELNSAFNFRRSINTDEYSDAFDKTGKKFSDNSSNNNNGDDAATATAIMTEGEMAMAASGGMVGGEILGGVGGSTTTTIMKKRKLVRRKNRSMTYVHELPVGPMLDIPSSLMG
jgi:hypothetical protein